MRERTHHGSDPTLARAQAVCRAHGFDVRPAREVAAQDAELRRLRGERGQLALPSPESMHERGEQLERELAEARAELERQRELRAEDAKIVRAALRYHRAEVLARRSDTSGPAVLAHERAAIEARCALLDACADLALRRIARALRETDDAPSDTPAAVDAFAHELRSEAG